MNTQITGVKFCDCGERITTESIQSWVRRKFCNACMKLRLKEYKDSYYEQNREKLKEKRRQRYARSKEVRG